MARLFFGPCGCSTYEACITVNPWLLMPPCRTASVDAGHLHDTDAAPQHELPEGFLCQELRPAAATSAGILGQAGGASRTCGPCPGPATACTSSWTASHAAEHIGLCLKTHKRFTAPGMCGCGCPCSAQRDVLFLAAGLHANHSQPAGAHPAPVAGLLEEGQQQQGSLQLGAGTHSPGTRTSAQGGVFSRIKISSMSWEGISCTSCCCSPGIAQAVLDLRCKESVPVLI